MNLRTTRPRYQTHDLPKLFERLAPQAPLSHRLDWLESLATWLLGESGRSSARERLRFLIEILRNHPAWKDQVSYLIRSVLSEASAVHLFSGTGLPTENGFLAELSERSVQKMLPLPLQCDDLAHLIARFFSNERSAEWLERLPEKLFAEARDLLFPSSAGAGRESLHPAMSEAILLLSSDIRSAGLTESLRKLGPEEPPSQSPFLRLSRACDRFYSAYKLSPSQDLHPEAERIREAIEASRQRIRKLHHRMERAGVRVGYVYRIERMSLQLTRIESLVEFLDPHHSASDIESLHRFVSQLVRGAVRERSVRALLSDNLGRLCRKMVEHAGNTGEHYLARNPSEYFSILGRGLGGGILTVFAIVFKCLSAALSLSLFMDAVVSSLNYASNFLCMYFVGFRLATKQPSMTAAWLAGRLESHVSDPDGCREGLAQDVTQITQSQFAAVLGNVGAVIVGGVSFDLVWRFFHGGASFMSGSTAHHFIESLHPFRSGTLCYAALTGVALWLSSLASGWMENWAKSRQLRRSLIWHPWLLATLGVRRTVRLSRFISRHAPGFASNASLGTMLGTLPVLGRFLGAALDVRHITLCTGALTLAVCALGIEPALHAGFAWACAGLLFIGVLNFGVAFTLSLAVAMRATGIHRPQAWDVLSGVARKLLLTPWRCLTPWFEPTGKPEGNALGTPVEPGAGRGPGLVTQAPTPRESEKSQEPALIL